MKRPILLIAITSLVAAAQPMRVAKGTQWMEFVLERNDAGTWRPIDAGLILNNQDLVRFRFRANFTGYLYVIDAGSSGSRSLLFPMEQTGGNNRFAADREYAVPSTEAAFRISGPSGSDTVYWLVSPVPLTGDSMVSRIPEGDITRPGPLLLPRCNDSIFRVRGECTEPSPPSESLSGPVIYELRLDHR